MIIACYNKNEEIRKNSSSGGVYYAVAKQVIDDGGVVYAAVYEGIDVTHNRFDSFHNLEKSCGSKYSQSKLSDCFSSVKSDLLAERKVLFVGTPCQCYGLKTYLDKVYVNLITIDFVCHGIPSKKVLAKYVDEQSFLQPVDEINMRDKSSGWSNYQYSWKLKNTEAERTIPQSCIVFMKGFTNDLYLRPCCYECQFKGTERITDITLGDYWGVWDIHPNMDDNKGTSLIMLHSEHGRKMFETIADQLVNCEISDIAKVISWNPSIIRAASKTSKRGEFFEKLNSGEKVEKIINELTVVPEQNRITQRLKNRIKRLIGR